MDQTVSVGHSPLRIGVRSQVSRSGICGGQSSNRTGFTPSAWGFQCQCKSITAAHSSSVTSSCYQKENRVNAGNLTKCTAFLEIGKDQIEMCCHFLFP